MTMDRLGTGSRIRPRRLRARWAAASRSGLTLVVLLCGSSLAHADKIKNGTAVFSGLDKITGRIISFQAAMGETVQFGSLKVTSRVCYTRPATEMPQTDTFVEVDEVSAGNDDKRIFSGWMYAASPGLHGIEHPIYDIWLTDCKGPGETIAETVQTADAEDPNAIPAPGVPGASQTPAADPALKVAPAPKPKRAARPAPTPAVEAEHREPTQRFFPASQYPTDVGANNVLGSHSR